MGFNYANNCFLWLFFHHRYNISCIIPSVTNCIPIFKLLYLHYYYQRALTGNVYLHICAFEGLITSVQGYVQHGSIRTGDGAGVKVDAGCDHFDLHAFCFRACFELLCGDVQLAVICEYRLCIDMRIDTCVAIEAELNQCSMVVPASL